MKQAKLSQAQSIRNRSKGTKVDHKLFLCVWGEVLLDLASCLKIPSHMFLVHINAASHCHCDAQLHSV